jgi:hypothetical protein
LSLRERCENLLHFFRKISGEKSVERVRYNRLDCRKNSPMTGKKTIQSSARVAGKNGFSLISDDTFRKIYAALLQCGMLDEQLRDESTYEQWAGGEASSAGVVACLHHGDTVALTPRGLLAAYLLSGSLTPTGNAATTSAAQLTTATADALRHKLEALGNVAVVFADGGEPDRMRDIFAAADRQHLPILYVFEASTWIAGACGTVPVIRVDCRDAVALYRVAHESIARAREGGGPTIIECAAWPDKGEPQDPLKKLEVYLADKKLFRQNWKQQLQKKYEMSLNEAIKSFKSELIKK